jgi:DNA repair protein RadC
VILLSPAQNRKQGLNLKSNFKTIMTKTEKNRKAIQEVLKVCEVRAIYSHKTPAKDRPQVINAQKCYDILLPLYQETGHLEQKEIFSILLLDRKNSVIGWAKISEGSNCATIVDSQYIFRLAILSNASSLVLCHNHPSGNVNPSNADMELTKKMVQSAKLLDITILDHVIISAESHYSFANEGHI